MTIAIAMETDASQTWQPELSSDVLPTGDWKFTQVGVTATAHKPTRGVSLHNPSHSLRALKRRACVKIFSARLLTQSRAMAHELASGTSTSDARALDKRPSTSIVERSNLSSGTRIKKGPAHVPGLRVREEDVVIRNRSASRSEFRGRADRLRCARR
jgi:hypothetical protein